MTDATREKLHDSLTWWDRYGSKVAGLLVLALAVIVGILIATQRDLPGRVAALESPCQKNAESKACRDLRRKVLKAEPPAITCLIFRNVNYPCPLPEVIKRQVKRTEREGGGDGASPPTTPTTPTVPPSNGGGGSDGNLGNDPSDPPNPPDDDGPIGDILDGVCTITSPLGICLQ
jgi:hypothetical protein